MKHDKMRKEGISRNKNTKHIISDIHNKIEIIRNNVFRKIHLYSSFCFFLILKIMSHKSHIYA